MVRFFLYKLHSRTVACEVIIGFDDNIPFNSFHRGRAKLCVANSFDITLRSKWVPRYDVYDDIVDLAQTYLVVEEVRAMHKKVNDHIPKDIALCNEKNWNHFRRMRVTTMPTSIHPWHVHLQLKNDSEWFWKLIPDCQDIQFGINQCDLSFLITDCGHIQ